MEVSGGRNVTENSSIVFDNKTVQTGCTATSNETSNTITLRRPGFYKVDFNAVLSNDDATNEFIGVVLERNGVEVQEAQTGASSSATSDMQSVSFSTLVRVRPNCCAVDNTVRLQFKVTGTDALIYFANVVVTKIA